MTKKKTGKEQETIWMIDFSSETIEARRQWDNIFQVLKEKKLLTQNSISIKIPSSMTD